MLHGDTTTAWALYDELIEKGLSPHPETWDALFKGVRKTEEEEGKEAEAVSQSEHHERLQKILLYMRNNQIYPQHSLASSIKTWFERYKMEIKTLRVRWETEAECTLYYFLNSGASVLYTVNGLNNFSEHKNTSVSELKVLLFIL